MRHLLRVRLVEALEQLHDLSGARPEQLLQQRSHLLLLGIRQLARRRRNPDGDRRVVAGAPARGRPCRYGRVQPPEPARPLRAWNSTAVRLGGLLLCLGVLVFALVAQAGDGGGSNRSTSACVGRIPSPATIDFAELTRLRATLLGAMARAGGRRYQGGPAQPTALWTDDSPQAIASARREDRTWPAGYEIRQWSSAGDDIAADAFTFRTPAQARALFDAASSARCHEHGKVAPAFSPAGARNLVWVNPDAALQADAFLLHGSTVYRVAVVRGSRPPARSASSGRPTTVQIANGLACALPGAGCSQPETTTQA